MNECCYLGRGKVYIIESEKLLAGWGNNWGFFWGGNVVDYFGGRFLGNVSTFGIDVNYNQAIGINRQGITFDGDCAMGTINGATVNLSLECQSMENLSLALYGEKSVVSTSDPAVVDQIYPPSLGDAYLIDSILVFGTPLVDTSTLIVKRGDTLAVLVDGVDYVATQATITMLIDLPVDVELVLSFSWLGTSYQRLDTFTMPEKDYTLTFIGHNMAASNEIWMATLFKVRLSPLSQYNFINQDFQQLILSGTLLKDHVKVGGGNSGYFEIKKVIQ